MANEGIMALPQGQQGQSGGVDQAKLNALVPKSSAFNDIDKTLSGLDPNMAAQYKAAIAPVLQGLKLSTTEIDTMIQLFDYLAEHKSEYPQIVAELVRQGILQQGDLPEKFDDTLISVIQLVLHEMKGQAAPTEEQQGIGSLPQGQESMQPPFAMKQGGLVEIAHMLQSQGRNGDTMLAHINPEEAAMLKAMGGSGTINPATGLREYGLFSSIGRIFSGIGSAISGAVKSVVNVAKDIISSPVGRIIATIGLTMALGPLGLSLPMTAGLASAGVTALGGGSFADIVKSGLMAGVTAGAFQAMGGTNPLGTSGTQAPAPVVEGSSAMSGAPAAAPPPASFAPPVDPGSSIGAFQPQTISSIPTVDQMTQQAASVGGTSLPGGAAPQGLPSGGFQGAGVDNGLPAWARSAPAATEAATLPASGFKNAGVDALPSWAGGPPSAPAAAASAAPASAGSEATGMLGNAVDWAKTNPISAAALGVTAATAMGAGKPSETNQKPLGEQWGTGNATGEQYMKDHPEIFGNWKGWKTPGAANQGTPPTPGPTPMNPVSNNPYMMPGGNLNPNPMPQQGNQPYNMPGLYDPRRFAQQQQPPQPQYNTGGPVNNAHVSGSGMQQSMTNAFSGGGGIGALPPSSFAQGGNTNYPRRTGVIEGPGTETSDSIPAMLSDGEFVFTAKAVKNAGRGSRRDGAKRMYQLMHMLEHGGKV